MSDRFPVVTSNQLIGILERLGFQHRPLGATSHRRYVHPDARKTKRHTPSKSRERTSLARQRPIMLSGGQRVGAVTKVSKRQKRDRTLKERQMGQFVLELEFLEFGMLASQRNRP